MCNSGGEISYPSTATTAALVLGVLLLLSSGGGGLWGSGILVAADVDVKWTDVAPMPHPVGETSAGILKVG